ncbi:hypothetical protein L3X38_025923 [Prunus dulcis]|uniref:Uncharacterized protein n=1 Tax=Prunus dulcis TaxID=3755 RepID=A0AAD4W2N5_PRUDU|nr:hypothetical protein L3X38_025923 [Prunus dulcis]
MGQFEAPTMVFSTKEGAATPPCALVDPPLTSPSGARQPLTHLIVRRLSDDVTIGPFKITKFSNFLNPDWFLPSEASLKRTLIQRLIFELLENCYREKTLQQLPVMKTRLNFWNAMSMKLAWFSGNFLSQGPPLAHYLDNISHLTKSHLFTFLMEAIPPIENEEHLLFRLHETLAIRMLSLLKLLKTMMHDGNKSGGSQDHDKVHYNNGYGGS